MTYNMFGGTLNLAQPLLNPESVLWQNGWVDLDAV